MFNTRNSTETNKLKLQILANCPEDIRNEFLSLNDASEVKIKHLISAIVICKTGKDLEILLGIRQEKFIDLFANLKFKNSRINNFKTFHDIVTYQRKELLNEWHNMMESPIIGDQREELLNEWRDMMEPPIIDVRWELQSIENLLATASDYNLEKASLSYTNLSEFLARFSLSISDLRQFPLDQGPRLFRGFYNQPLDEDTAKYIKRIVTKITENNASSQPLSRQKRQLMRYMPRPKFSRELDAQAKTAAPKSNTPKTAAPKSNTPKAAAPKKNPPEKKASGQDEKSKSVTSNQTESVSSVSSEDDYEQFFSSDPLNVITTFLNERSGTPVSTINPALLFSNHGSKRKSTSQDQQIKKTKTTHDKLDEEDTLNASDQQSQIIDLSSLINL